jgi:microcystin-dependent protein
MDEYLAIVKIFAGNFAPKGWAFCQGQIMSIAQNTALFSLLGTTYGGNGQTTFALPDLRGRAPIGVGQGPGLSNYVLGQLGGTENVTLTTNNLPAHNHPVTGTVQLPVNGDSADAVGPEGTYPAISGTNIYSNAPVSGQFAGNLSVNLQTGIAGGSQPVPVLNPYLAMNYIICLEGIFPSRN